MGKTKKSKTKRSEKSDSEVTNVESEEPEYGFMIDKFEVLGSFTSRVFYARDHSKLARCDHDFQAIVLIKSVDIFKKRVLDREIEVYKALKTQTGFPALHWSGEWNETFCIAIDYRGCSLEMLRINLPEALDPKTMALFAAHMIDRIRHLHNVGFIHGDIKPDNFTLGAEAPGCAGIRGIAMINLIDFGSAIRIEEETTLDCFTNPAFTSIRALLVHPLAKIHDLESLAYTLIYLLIGLKVPWIEKLPACMFMGQRLMASIKSKIVPEELCKDLPPIYAEFLRYTRELDEKAEPDYIYFIKMFKFASRLR